MRLQLQSTMALVQRLARIHPHYGQPELLRMGLLLSLHRPDVTADDAVFERLSDEDLLSLSQEISLRLSAAGDQHSAVADELDSLAAMSPCDFSPSHVFTLVRAIKTQSRVLDLYLGPVEMSN